MSSPIYSNDFEALDSDDKLKRHAISLLSKATVDDINTRLTFVKHGIFIFIQYRENSYIVNGFTEDVFWNIISNLYKLIHDCSGEIIKIFLQTVPHDGKEVLKPFNLTDINKAGKFDAALEFIQDIENMRIVHYHNMKPDSEQDKSRIKKVERKLEKISGNNAGPKTEVEWDKCISWVHTNCERIYMLLDERLKFLQTNATSTQRDSLRNQYYSRLEDFYEKSMFDIIKGLLRKKHIDNKDTSRIQALVNTNKEEIAQKALDLIENSSKRADPYYAVVQAADIILTQKKHV